MQRQHRGHQPGSHGRLLRDDDARRRARCQPRPRCDPYCAAGHWRGPGHEDPDPAPERVQSHAQDLAMQFDVEEVFETASMTLYQNLDIRTTTLGVNLKDCIDSDFGAFEEKVYQKVRFY